MPISAYQESNRQDRTQAARSARRTNTLKTHRHDIERVQECHDDLESGRELVERYDAPEGEFRSLVDEQHDAMIRRRVFLCAVLAYVIGEFFVAGNVAEWLATEVMPMIKDLKWDADATVADVDVESGGVPLWLRRAVGAGFVGLMLAGTLVLKFLTHWVGSRVKAVRQALLPGEHGRAAFLSVQAAGLTSLKVVFLAMVAGLYVWLFGFSQERAEFVDLMKQEAAGIVDPLSGFEIDEAGNLRTQDELPDSNDSDGTSQASGAMAYATAVCYIICWCIHGLLLWFPVNGFSGNLRYARFDRETALAEAEQSRRERVRVNRQILERIDEEANPDTKESLVRAIQPIRHLIMEDAGQEEEPGSDSPDAGASVTAPPGPQPQSPSATAYAEPEPVESAAVPATNGQQDANVFDLLFGSEGDEEGQAA